MTLSRFGLGYVAPLEQGDAGIAQTIRAIRSLVDDAWKDSRINRTAIDIIRAAGADQFDDDAKARAIFNWLMANMYFVNDPVTKEALRPAIELLELRAGDCDDINAVLAPSLLGTIGIEPRIVTIAANPSDPNSFSHVYAEANINGEWVPFDAARPGTAYGSAPPSFFRRAWWSLTDDSCQDYPGPGQLAGMRAYRGEPRLALGLAGISPSTSALLSTLSTDAANALSAVDGTPVINVVNPAQGPGGSQLYTQAILPNQVPESWFDEPSAITGISNGEFLVGAGVGFLLLSMAMKKRR